jgi:hypothetical protein
MRRASNRTGSKSTIIRPPFSEGGLLVSSNARKSTIFIKSAPPLDESLLAEIESALAKIESPPAQIQSLLAADESLRPMTHPLPSVNHNNGRKLKAPASNGLRSE